MKNIKNKLKISIPMIIVILCLVTLSTGLYFFIYTENFRKLVNNYLWPDKDFRRKMSEAAARQEKYGSKIIREAVARQLNKDPNKLTDVDFRRVEDIHLRSTIYDIKLIAKCTNLRTLSLYKFPINDITPLANLTKLKTLDLSGTYVRDLEPLANLTDLQILDLSRTRIIDIKPLANLINLKTLKLSLTAVSDITPLANLTNLQTLSLINTNVNDEQVEEMKKMLPNIKITYGHSALIID
jgi:hypothetical protein